LESDLVTDQLGEPRALPRGFSLIETVMAISVLTIGVVGTASVLTTGMRHLSSSPADVIMTQKAQQAIEAVFSARDSHRLTWAQIRNVHGVSNDNGIFLDGPQPLHTPGADGLVNTADDDMAIETMILPGRDQLIGTSDDTSVALTAYTREIAIRDVANENGELRSITVTVTFLSGPTSRTYTLTTFISAYS
jgi:prepilin-type N-terminal cleavage/methylation domain-containing protein